ncbi:hypothetical protein N5853_00660 [Bartonella sp. HY329]|uniref:hypothetical protein n=1 Tax=unclassified Bartonella TaxID=2645622 RepID=UPI0021C9D22F|nr:MULTISPECIES: hypothetical protein [unclassified Bartonella]UXM95205.1 hypothetical protein N5853_00660 [Bartonella sp. HY329]UXN09528.1 hypothetical protein N5852_00665 [Bartonella sp. HY328]
MIKFLKIAISILLISSLLTACTKKPEYYQAAYSQPKQKGQQKKPVAKNTRPIVNDKNQQVATMLGKPPSILETIASIPLILGVLLIVGLSPGEIKM